jgi:putative flippase GtrA
MARLGIGFARGSLRVPQLRAPIPGAAPRKDLALQAARFTVIGMACTIAYLVLFLLLRGIVSAQAANLISLLVTAVANTAANRRLTFGISGRSNAARHQVKGLIAFGVGLALTSGSLAALAPAHAGRPTEVAVLIAANLVATVVRFLLYRHWVFGGPRRRKWARKWAAPDRPPKARPGRPVEARPDGTPLVGTAHGNEMATQGERTN